MADMHSATPRDQHAEPASGWRERLVRDLEGDVLEVGVGSGTNLPMYRRARHVWAIEPNREAVERARSKIGAARVPVTIDTAPAEALPYDDGSFDNVVSSLVFCSVDSPEAALAEIARVLRPGGTLHMVEHVRPENPLVGGFFHLITPVWSRLASNCHLDRPTVHTLCNAGWEVTIVDRRLVFIQLTARPPAPAEHALAA